MTTNGVEEDVAKQYSYQFLLNLVLTLKEGKYYLHNLISKQHSRTPKNLRSFIFLQILNTDMKNANSPSSVGHSRF